MNDYNAPRYLAALLPAALLAACAHAPKKPAPAVSAPQSATVSAPAAASATPAPVMQPAAPQRYTVKKGDTLWGISSMYLKDAWNWPDIWYANPAIKNPHLIYPGDVLILGYNQEGRPSLSVERNGQVVSEAPAAAPLASVEATNVAPANAAPQAPVVMNNLPVTKLEPQVRYQSLSDAVTTVPLEGLRPFLSKTRIVSKSEMEDAGYLLQAEDSQPVMGANTEVYVRDLKPAEGTRYTIYHLGDAYVDPDSGDTLGYEATYIGEASVKNWGDPQTAIITSSAQDARAGDRFLPQVGNGALDLSFPPHRPAKTVNGQIMAVLGGVAQIGQYDVVVLNRGNSTGVDPGTVLGIYRRGKKSDNGAVTLPTERSGTLMVFRSFDKASYAVVMQASREIHLEDVVANP